MGDGQKIIDGLNWAILRAKLSTPEMRERVARAIARKAAEGTVDAWRDGGVEHTVRWTWPRHLNEADAALAEIAAALSTPDAQEAP